MKAYALPGPEKAFLPSGDPTCVSFRLLSDGSFELTRRNAAGESETIDYPAADCGALLVVTAHPGGTAKFEIEVRRVK